MNGTSESTSETPIEQPNIPVLNIRLPNKVGQNRLITFFKPIIMIPWLVWYTLWNIAVLIITVLTWFALIFTAGWPAEYFRFSASFVRFEAQYNSWLLNLTDAWPSFSGRPDDQFGATIDIRRKDTYVRWKVGFRLILAIPWLIVANFLPYGVALLWFISWWVVLFLGRQPSWLRQMTTLLIGVNTRISAYIYLLVEEYPRPYGEDDEFKSSPDPRPGLDPL